MEKRLGIEPSLPLRRGGQAMPTMEATAQSTTSKNIFADFVREVKWA
jgi:hypothetical protein